jgi:hypothetical protein
MKKPFTKQEIEAQTRYQLLLHIARLAAEFTMLIGFIVIIVLVLKQAGLI